MDLFKSALRAGEGGRELDKIYIWLEIMAGFGFGLVILLFTASDSFKHWKYIVGFMSATLPATLAQLIVFISLRFPA